MELKNTLAAICAAVTVLMAGGMAGLFFAFSVSVMPGLDATRSAAAIGSMQSINQKIQNPVFLLTFVGLPVVAILAGVMSLFPVTFMLLGSVKTRGEFLANPFGIPHELTFTNFTGLLHSEFAKYFLNSIVIAVVTVSGTVVLAVLAAYPLSRFRTRLNTPTMLFFLAGIMIPVHVTLIPIYVLTQQMRMYDSIAGLFGPYMAFNLPTAVFVLAGFFRQISESLFDAAKIDGAGHWRILLVEDDPDTMRIMSRLLRRLGYEVDSADSVRAALEKVGKEHYDLLISDLGLPDGSGLDVMREIRRRYGLKGLAISGYGTDEDIRESREAGFQQLLTKPVTVGTLESAVREMTAVH